MGFTSFEMHRPPTTLQFDLDWLPRFAQPAHGNGICRSTGPDSARHAKAPLVATRLSRPKRRRFPGLTTTRNSSSVTITRSGALTCNCGQAGTGRVDHGLNVHIVRCGCLIESSHSMCTFFAFDEVSGSPFWTVVGTFATCCLKRCLVPFDGAIAALFRLQT